MCTRVLTFFAVCVTSCKCCLLAQFERQVNNTGITFRGILLVNGKIITVKILIVVKLARQLLLRFQVSHIRLAKL